ncbi:MAG: bleomycin resistance protein [Alphaproteobacteria bacterium]|nr:bleomycin resistance protein [Alphaproteobacteria bacterium]
MIKVQNIVYTSYRAPDLDKMEQFLTDFGMIKAMRDGNRLFMRGHGDLPYITCVEKGDAAFVAPGFEVKSMAELEAATKIAGASAIETIDAPGGGKRVRLTGPDGFRIDLVHGQQKIAPLSVREPLQVNFAMQKQRVGALQRPVIEPAKIFRIGHCVLKVSDADAAVAWFRDTLGMLVTDRLHLPDNPKVTLGTFLRCNRGSAPADHHTILCLQKMPDEVCKVHHSSYEVQDPDAVQIGHYWLKAKGWNNEWGVGRHLLGSQVFDYWRDPWGHMFEHYADGDLLDDKAVAGDYPAIQENLAQWGPEVTPTFFN